MNYTIETGLRGCLRHPSTMALSIITLALGLASVMTMLSLMSILSADPLPGLSHKLYLGWVDSRAAPRSGNDSEESEAGRAWLWKLGDIKALRDARPEIRQVGLVSGPVDVASVGGEHSETGVSSVFAIGPMPSVFGVPLLHGRFWTDQEEREQTPVVIISRELSQKLLGRDNGVGADIRIGSSNFRVIGISDRWAPRPRAHFLTRENPGWQGDGDQLFAPALPMLDARINLLSNRECDSGGYGGMRFNEIDIGDCRWLALWAELETAQQRESYRDTLQEYSRDRHASGAFARKPDSRLYSMSQWLRINQVVPDSVRLNLWLALGLLTLCLVNVAGLLAARFLRRGAELGVRRVLGASRGAIIGSCLVESGLAGLLGGLLALPLTLGGLWLVRQQGQDYASLAHFSTALFAVLLVLSLAIGLLVGLLPALRAARQQPALQVKTL